MKTVIFDPDTPYDASGLPSVTLVADSALVMPGRPLFLPDFSQHWRGIVYLGVRISKLGKGVAPKFARRYYDAVCAAFHPLAFSDTGERIGAGFAGLYDGAVVLGRMLGAEEGAEYIDAEYIDIACGLQTLAVDMAMVDKAVSAVSYWSTLKTGDIIMPAGMMLDAPLRVGDMLEATVNGVPSLKVKIK